MAPSLFRQDAEPDQAPAATGPAARPQPDLQDTRRKRRDENETVSVLGSGLTIEGTVTSHGDVRIEGTLKGDLTSDGEVNVTSTGVIDGDVTASRLVVAGKVNGSLSATDSARLSAGCRVEANVSSPRVQLDDGATLNGRVDMGGSAKPSTRPQATGQKTDRDSQRESKRDSETESKQDVA